MLNLRTAILSLSTLSVLALYACGDDGGTTLDTGRRDTGSGDASGDTGNDSGTGDSGGQCGAVICVNGGCVSDTCQCDAGWEGAACDTLTPPPSNNLLLWLDADDPAGNGSAPVAGALTTWVDKGGDSYDFEAKGDGKPMVVVDGTRHLVRFDGVDDAMFRDAFDALTDKISYTIIVVGVGEDNQDAFISGFAEGESNLGLTIETAAGSNMRFYHDGNSDGTGDQSLSNDGSRPAGLARFWAVRENPDLVLHIADGLGLKVTGSEAAFEKNLDLALGNREAHFLKGDIAEVLIYLGELRPNGSPELVAYLQAKWGVQ